MSEARLRVKKLEKDGQARAAAELSTVIQCADHALLLAPGKLDTMSWAPLKAASEQLEANGFDLPMSTKRILTSKYAVEQFLNRDYKEWAESIWLHAEDGDWDVLQPKLRHGNLASCKSPGETIVVQTLIHEVIFNEGLFTLIKNPLENHAEIIKALSSLLFKVCGCPLASECKELLAPGVKACLGLMALVNPEPAVLGCSAEHVEYLVTDDKKVLKEQAKSKQSFFHQVSQGKSFLAELRKDSWKGLTNEFLKQSGVDAARGAEFQDLKYKLVAACAGLDAGGSPDAPEIKQTLLAFNQNIKYYQESFRAGATDALVSTATSIVTKLFEHAKQAFGPDASSTDITRL